MSDDVLVRAGLERMLQERGLGHAELDAAEVAIVDRSSAQIPSLGIPVVALVDRDARPTEALAEGATAVLPRDASGERIAAAAWAVGQGLVVVDQTMARSALPDTERDPLDIEDLTHREREVLGLIAAGLSNKRIAERLDISAHTAKFHVSSILAKLGVSTRAEAVVVAARRGVLWL